MTNPQPIASHWRFMIAKSLATALPRRVTYYSGGGGFGCGGTIGRSPPHLSRSTEAACYTCRLPGVNVSWRITNKLPAVPSARRRAG